MNNSEREMRRTLNQLRHVTDDLAYEVWHEYDRGMLRYYLAHAERGRLSPTMQIPHLTRYLAAFILGYNTAWESVGDFRQRYVNAIDRLIRPKEDTHV